MKKLFLFVALILMLAFATSAAAGPHEGGEIPLSQDVVSFVDPGAVGQYPVQTDTRRLANTVQGYCFYPYSSAPKQHCGTVYVYVKNASGVWYVAASAYGYPSGDYGPISYTQPASSGNNLYLYATSVCGRSGVSPQTHADPGQSRTITVALSGVCA